MTMMKNPTFKPMKNSHNTIAIYICYRAIIYMLETDVQLSQAKKAKTQYLTIPAQMVSDSQYPFKDTDKKHFLTSHPLGLIVLTEKENQLDQPQCPECKSYDVDVGAPLYVGRPFDAESISKIIIPCNCSCGHSFEVSGVVMTFINTA